ncbi:hypothetical protein [uncultured Phenylobacterium sp.]|uniref:hypothetical protein n=1 Tax=uncultured Phenylobacterium sp. TaxID=349273 RepID=UPI0025E971B0|nr:hypothetical protein [uncultured Phenylobacterium sp.]
MRPLFLLAASTLALTSAACGPTTPTARAALDCPTNQGDLTRTSASADGKTCTYATSSGAEVTLQLVSTQGGVDKALTAIETTLLEGRIEAGKDTAEAEDAKGEAAAINAEAGTPADKAMQEANADSSKAGVDISVSDNDDAVHIGMKDGTVVAKGSRDGTTTVNLPGIHVVANERDDTASVSVGPIHIDAGGDGATIRMRRDVRLRGEALNPDRRGMRATFIYTGDDLPNGYRFVGYEAAGPKTGPITVAVVKSKSEGPNGGELYPDVKRLVRKNGGV